MRAGIAFLAPAVLVCAVTAASATPIPTLYWTSADIGGGLTAFDFTIDCDDGLAVSYAVTLLFQADLGSTINQVRYMGLMDVNTEADATAYDGQGSPPYSKARDTWVYSPFAPTPGMHPMFPPNPFTGFDEGPGWYAISVSSGPGSHLGDDTKVVHLVAGGLQSGTWTGTIARSSVLYPTSGAYPEPATMAILGAGAFALLRRRK